MHRWRFTFELNVAGQNSPQWNDAVKVDQYLSDSAFRTIQFPIEQTVRRFRTDGYYMYPPLDPNVPGSKYYLTSVDLAFITPMEEYDPAGFRPISAALYFHSGAGGSPCTRE